ncbi:MAG TPA: GxxExxY protein [Saprospiraceae bacterium]|nr:GxxExxY protein [Saprospiraceae bacterium]
MISLTKDPAIMSENEIATVVIGICIEIHRKWGPGLLESVYEALLVHHLRARGFFVEQQLSIPFEEDGVKLKVGFRADVIVEKKLLVELKSVEIMHPVYFKRTLTYIRILHLKLGLLINFTEAYLKDGITRVINGILE